ncbi:MAG TPA: hydrogenase-4 component E [Xanthobacteraceae bacterium]
MPPLLFDIAHLLAAGMLIVSFLLLYQDRASATLNAFALQAILLSFAVAWQAYIQDAPHLIFVAMIALVLNGFILPTALHRIVRRLGIHRDIELAIGRGPTMLIGFGLVALSAVLILPAGHGAGLISREGLAFALAVVLLGMLMMVARRNAVAQIVGFMSLENGLVLAVSGAKGMPLVVEISVALSILMIVMVFGVFAFPVRERYDAVDVSALHRLRGERADV